MKNQPEYLEVIKVVQHSPLVRTVFAKDEKGNIWKRLEGFVDAKWDLYRRADGHNI